MVDFLEVPVGDDRAQSLLTSYFADRARTFPAGPSAYQTVFPEPARFVPPEGAFLLVRDDTTREAVGCGGIRRLSEARYEVKHLWLEPVARGRGWGRRLLAQLELRAASFGATEVVLDTNASLEAAAGLYRSSGYGTVPPYNDNPNATNWYLKTLRGNS
jgi:ribosomal protein S18 acetylase RimI-like enzyme